MDTDPLALARARGLDRLAAQFPDALAAAAAAAARMRAQIPRALDPRAEPAGIQPPPDDAA